MKNIIYILFFLLLINNGVAKAQEKLIVSYTVPLADQMKMLSDYKITPSNATASNSESSGGIKLSYDGKYETHYHSSYSNTTFPITLKYDFKNVEKIEKLIYVPRQDGHSNGNFKEIEIWYTLEGGKRTLYNSFNFQGSGSANTIEFTNPLIKPIQIEVIVKSGVGDNGTGYASCAEMEFYKKNTETEKFLDLFSDRIASKLKSTTNLSKINMIANPHMRQLALDIYNKNYSTDTRVGEYKAHGHLNVLNEKLIAEAYNKYENPTGIYFPIGQHIVIVDGIESGNPASLRIPDYRFTHEGGNIQSKVFPLSNGVNVIELKDWDGLGYVDYRSDTPETEKPINVHFVNSQVHGYFDITKHNNHDWVRLLDNATDYPVMDAVGKYSQLTFPIEDYKKYAAVKGIELVEAYDLIVTYQHRFIGLEKYNKRPHNRILCRVNYSYFMFKDGDGASFEKGTLSYVLNPDQVFKQSWGMGHEIGHIHQMKFVNWTGMGEVSVNFPNIYINHLYPSNVSTNISRQKARRGMNAIYNKGISHAGYNGDGYNDHKLIPFAILYHYMRTTKSNPDFYADLYEAFRNSKEDTSNWNISDFEYFFVKKACEVAKLNLIPYFENWGFLYATDINGREPFMIEDYSKEMYSLKQSKVNELKNYIQDKGYTTPDPSEIVSDNIINLLTNIDK